MLYWRRLGNCSGFELKCCPDLESTRTKPGVDSPMSGVDSVLLETARSQGSRDLSFGFTPSSRLGFSWSRLGSQSLNTGLLSLELNCLGVDSDFAGVDSALRHRSWLSDF